MFEWDTSCVDFMDVIMGDIPIYSLTTLCLNGRCTGTPRVNAGRNNCGSFLLRSTVNTLFGEQIRPNDTPVVLLLKPNHLPEPMWFPLLHIHILYLYRYITSQWPR